jgi:uncharacterized damage-inducible protein DinB
MLIDGLRVFYAYGGWATRRLLDTCAGLPPEQWLAPGNAGRGSVRDTLVHIVGAQTGWLAFWQGKLEPGLPQLPLLNPSDYPDVESVRAAWSEAERATGQFLDGLSPEDLERVHVRTYPGGRTYPFKLWQMLLHVANHGTYHRSEVAAMLTNYGRSPGDLDMSLYLRSLADEARR